jgi:hypothetical protein
MSLMILANTQPDPITQLILIYLGAVLVIVFASGSSGFGNTPSPILKSSPGLEANRTPTTLTANTRECHCNSIVENSADRYFDFGEDWFLTEQHRELTKPAARSSTSTSFLKRMSLVVDRVYNRHPSKIVVRPSLHLA